MRNREFLLLLGCLMHAQFTNAQKKPKPENRVVIIIEGFLPLNYKSDSIDFQFRPIQYDRFIYPLENKHIKQELKKGYGKWELLTDKPHFLTSDIVTRRMAHIVEPGDSLHIRYLDQKIIFSGIGSEKFQTTKMIESFLDSLEQPEGLSEAKRAPASSLEDYLAWNKYLNEKTKIWLNQLESKKNNISEWAYPILKGTLLSEIEKIRLHKFHSIRRSSITGPVNQYGLSNEDLCNIYDSTMNNASSKWLRFERPYILDADYTWDMLHDDNYRHRRKFFQVSETDTPVLGQDPTDQFVYIYNMIKEKYTGMVKEKLMAFTFYDAGGVLRKVGFTPKTENILTDYYAQPGYPESKRRVKDYEIGRREKWNQNYTAEFILTDAKGGRFTSQQLKGKVAVIDFWFTGCTGCVQMTPALKKVEEYFASDTNIVFISISVDKNKEQWVKSITQKKYTTGGGIQLYTGGMGNKHDIITKFLVESYPTLEIIGSFGTLIKYDKERIDPRHDNGQEMIAFLQKKLAELKDGPYVLYEDEKSTAYSLNGSYLAQKKLNKKGNNSLLIQTDQNICFSVSLKASLQIEPTEFPKPQRLFVLSDIEGNFDAFRKLLQSNRIIDRNYNWTFGTGHLVFGGDMFDRGRQVTECLWLIYSLEQKAKVAGGYVHFILGNHEIMNLQGDHNYVERKYKENAAVIGRTLAQLYNENSELGRWLRTKNIVEKIGEMLFLHGGISRKLNQLPLTVTEINQLARPNYALKKYDYNDERINSIMNSSTSPFWYRSYYDNKVEMSQIIDSTLRKFDVTKIITGHTIVADTISVHYGGKIINTDTHHAEGKSEALLIENGIYYRVNTRGEKIVLLSESRKRSINIIAD